MIIRRLLIGVVFLATAFVECRAQTPPVDLSALAGAWEVTAVELRPGRVQALLVDDPEYMGAVLDISDQRLAWRPHKGGTLDEVCLLPSLERGKLRCASVFGPPGFEMTVSDQRIVLLWYDNANLVLRRKR